MKTKSKRLIFAICLLLVSATILGTASYAWFSMNTEVTVDGIEVEAYSDSLFLEVSQNETSDFATSTTFENDKAYLRLAKHGFVATAYTLTATLVSTDTYYDGETVYYEKVEYADSNLKYVVATGLDTASSLVGLYKAANFVRIDNQDAVADTATTYYEKIGTKYAKISKAQGEETVGCYTLTDIDPETTGTYDGTGSYYKLAENGTDYYLVSNLSRGTNVKDKYYTLSSITAISTDTTADNNVTEFTGNAYVKSGNDYSLLGNFTDANIKNLLYFGRTYANDVNDVEGNKNGTLSIIKEANLDDYRLMNTVYLRNAVNTNDSRNLRANFNITGESVVKSSLTVLLVVTDGSGKLVNTVTYNNGTTTYGSGDTIINLLKGNTAETLTVDIYVYFDGSNADVNNQTDGVLELSGHGVEIEFTIDKPDYN